LRARARVGSRHDDGPRDLPPPLARHRPELRLRDPGDAHRQFAERLGGAPQARLPRPDSRPENQRVTMTSPAPRSRSFVRWLKRVLLSSAILATIVVLVLAFQPRPVPADVVEVKRGPLVVTVHEDGRARVKNRHVVSAPLSGSLARPELHPGDAVEAGTVIARIVPLDAPLLDVRSRSQAEARVAAALAAQRQARALVERAEAAREFAQVNAERMRQVADRGVATELQREQAELQLRTATAELESARFGAQVADSEVRMARAVLGRLT